MGKKIKRILIVLKSILLSVIIYIVNRVIFLFTDSIYKDYIYDQFRKDPDVMDYFTHKVKIKLEDKLDQEYNLLLSDYKKQNAILKKQAERWEAAYRNQKDLSSQNYWDGVRYGHKITEKQKAKSKKNLITEHHLFILHQVSKRNVVSGPGAFHLENKGYIRTTSNEEYNYELTTKGQKYLAIQNKRREELSKKQSTQEIE